VNFDLAAIIIETSNLLDKNKVELATEVAEAPFMLMSKLHPYIHTFYEDGGLACIHRLLLSLHQHLRLTAILYNLLLAGRHNMNSKYCLIPCALWGSTCMMPQVFLPN